MELLPFECVFTCAVDAVFEGTHDTPRNTISWKRRGKNPSWHENERIMATNVTYLAEFRQAKAEPRPLDFGRSASCETRTESIKMEPVVEARRAILFLMAGADKPFRP